ncbi:MAG: hypothetical protein AB1545_17680 [Thermodesulfobacteriota bacterium]
MKYLSFTLIVLISALLLILPGSQAKMAVNKLPEPEKSDEEINQAMEMLNKYQSYSLYEVEAAFVSGATEAMASIKRGETVPIPDAKKVVFHRSKVIVPKAKNASLLDLQLETEKDLKIPRGISRVSVIVTSDDRFILLSGETDFQGNDTAP